MADYLLTATAEVISDADASAVAHYGLSAGEVETNRVSAESTHLAVLDRPSVIRGATGTVSVDLTSGPVTLYYHPRESGIFESYVTRTDPDPWVGTVDYRDDEDETIASAPDRVAWSGLQMLKIVITPAGPAHQVVANYSWAYADRDTHDPVASGVLLMYAERTTLDDTPAALVLSVSNGAPGELVDFVLSGNGLTPSILAQSTLDDAGVTSRSVPIPKLERGTYVLAAEGDASGTDTVTFTVQRAPLNSTEEDGLEEDDWALPVPPTGGGQWEFIDRYNPALRWVFHNNPQEWSSPEPPNYFSHDAGTAPNAQIITWQAARRPYPMDFSGYIDTQAEYEELRFWSEQRRRFWLVDHRGRIWSVTCEHFDARARIVPNKPWAHDYTMRVVIFRRYA